MKFYMWSFLHYFMMISPFIIACILYVVYKTKSIESRRNIGIILSLLAVALLIGRNIEIFIIGNYKFDFEIVPLQICHFANFVLLYAFIKKSDTAFGLAFLFNLPLAYLSLVFADGLQNYATILSVRGQAYIWGHMLIVIITIYAYMTGFVRLNLKKYINVSILVTTLYITSLFVNNLFRILFNQRSNYFYAEHPEIGTPLEYFFNLGKVIYIGNFEVNIVYMIVMIMFGYFVTFTIYLLSFELPKYTQMKKQELIKQT